VASGLAWDDSVSFFWDDSASSEGVVVSDVGAGDVGVAGGVGVGVVGGDGGVGGVGIEELRELQLAWLRAKPAVRTTPSIKRVLSETQPRGSATPARSTGSLKFI
jgi:hypothetical protein